MTKHHRQTAAELGIRDDKLEAQFVKIMQRKDTEIELARARVSDEVWFLESRIMELEAKHVTS